MGEVHERLRALGEIADPLVRVADDLAAQCRVLCLDEFFVSDIGDAMILARLLECLFERGVPLPQFEETFLGVGGAGGRLPAGPAGILEFRLELLQALLQG